jgi:hypothetical protein
VSRHHTLPPIIYTPQPPELKKTRRRRGVGYTSAAGEVEDLDEASDGAPVRSAPTLPRHSRPVEATERRTPSPNGKLSDDTLRAMLDLQEQQPE